MSKKIKKTAKIAIVLGTLLALVALYNVTPLAKAAYELANRNVTLKDSRPSQTGVDYVFEADYAASSTKCLEVDFCTTARGACTGPTGFTTVGGDKGDVGDYNGWTYASWTFASVDANTAHLTYATGENGGANYKFVLGNLTNSSVEGTYYARIHAYSAVDCTGDIGSGNVAFSNIAGVTVSAIVAETLTFTIDDSAIGFGEMGTTNIRYATADEVGVDTSEPGNGEPSTLALSTNAKGGAGITIQDLGSGVAAGLYNTAATKLIAATAPSAVAGGTESYAVYAKNKGSGLTYTQFIAAGSEVLTRTPKSFITTSGPLSTNNTADIAAKTGISGTTEAGAYADTLILIATPTY